MDPEARDDLVALRNERSSVTISGELATRASAIQSASLLVAGALRSGSGETSLESPPTLCVADWMSA